MCNSWAFCIYQTLLKNLTDDWINQIKKLIKLMQNNKSDQIFSHKCWVRSHQMTLVCPPEKSGPPAKF